MSVMWGRGSTTSPWGAETCTVVSWSSFWLLMSTEVVGTQHLRNTCLGVSNPIAQVSLVLIQPGTKGKGEVILIFASLFAVKPVSLWRCPSKAPIPRICTQPHELLAHGCYSHTPSEQDLRLLVCLFKLSSFFTSFNTKVPLHVFWDNIYQCT